MKTLALLAVALTASQVFAQASGVQLPSRQTKTWTLTNCSAAAINSAVNCEVRDTTGTPEILGVEGYNLLTLEIFYDYSAGTGLTFKLQSCNEGLASSNCTDTTDWFDIQSVNINAGTATYTDMTVTKAASADEYFAISIGINYRRLRLNAITASGVPDASDKITVKARLASVPAM